MKDRTGEQTDEDARTRQREQGEKEASLESGAITVQKTEKIDKPIVVFDSDNSQNYIMIVLIALIQGSLDLCNLSYFYIYLYDLKTTPSELSVLQGISILPWVFKPWFGFISDHFKFMGYHKKSYIFTVSLLEFSTHILMFKYRFGLPLVIFCQVIQVGCVAFRNVIGGRDWPYSRSHNSYHHSKNLTEICQPYRSPKVPLRITSGSRWLKNMCHYSSVQKPLGQ